MTPAAARLGDPIAHNVFAPFLKRVGFTAGLVVEILIIVGTAGGKKGVQVAAKGFIEYALKDGHKVLKMSKFGGVGKWLGDIADCLDGAVIGHWLGGKLGAGLDTLFGTTGGMETGKISSGASLTFIEKKAAARMRDTVQCSGSTSTAESILGPTLGTSLPEALNRIANILAGSPDSGMGAAHVGMNVAQGSISVYIENYPAARVGDATKCDAIVSKGASTVGFGGTRITDPASVDRYEEGTGVANTIWLLEFVAPIMSLGGAAIKGIDNLILGSDPIWKSTDARSAVLKLLSVLYPPSKDVASIVDRSQKIKRALDKGEDLAIVLKGTELTAGKVVKSVNKSVMDGNAFKSFDESNNLRYELRPNGDVVVHQPDRVSEAEVKEQQRLMAVQKKQADEQQRQREREVYQPTRPHPGYRR